MDQQQHTRRATDWPKLDALVAADRDLLAGPKDGRSMIEAQGGGWMRWTASPDFVGMPPFVSPAVRLEVIFRSGVVADNVLPGGLRWSQTGSDGDVMRFRVMGTDRVKLAPAGEEAAGPNPIYHLSVPGYEPLASVLRRAYGQASSGKGAERHAQGQPFDRQPMQDIIRLYGVGFALGQAAKKAQESQRLPRERAVAELLGAINYLAGAVIALEAGATSSTTTKD